MKTKYIKLLVKITASIIVLIFAISIIKSKNNKAIQTSSSLVDITSELSNKKIGWGIKRNNNHD